MKRLIFTILCMVLGISLISCTPRHKMAAAWSSDADTHSKCCTDCGEVLVSAAHSFGAPISNGEGREVMICTVCSYTALAHSYSDGWTSDNEYHWHACIDSGCPSVNGKAQHKLGEPTVLKAATSEEEGISISVCSDCGRGVTEPIAKLPPKMSRVEWLAAFSFDNVMMEHTASIGMFGTVKSTVRIDGNTAELTTDGEVTYSPSSSVISSVDFAPYYDSFVNRGNGDYYAAELSFGQDGVFYTYRDCEISFADGKIARIYYTVDFGNLFGEMSDEYLLSEWGDVSITPPTLTAEQLQAAAAAEQFLCNFTLTYEVYSEDLYVIAQIKRINDIYTYEKREGMLEETLVASGYAPADDLAAELSAALLAVILHVDAESLVYDSILGFTLADPIENFAGTGKTLSELHISLDGDRLTELSYYLDEDGVTVSYYFEDYGDNSAEVNG